MKFGYSFPHPVLGLKDDVKGEFNVDIDIQRDSVNSEIIFRFKSLNISNEYFNSLLNNENAGPFVKIYCSSTLKTWTFYNKTEMRIHEDELMHYVELDIRILALQDNFEYYDESFNSEFGDQPFIVDKNDTLGILETKRIQIPKQDEKLGLGNIFKFRQHKDPNRPLEINVNSEDYIEITYPVTDGEHPHTYLFNKYPWTAYNIFIIPALQEAFKFIDEDERTASQYKWFTVIDNLLPKEERTGIYFTDAQLLLDEEIPMIKSYSEISKN